MADTRTLEERRGALLDQIERADVEIAKVERAIDRGEASPEAGLAYKRLYSDERDNALRALGKIDALLERSDREQRDFAAQPDRIKEAWKLRQEPSRALGETARSEGDPERKAASKDDREDWWNNRKPQQQETPGSEPARAAEIERPLPARAENERFDGGDNWWKRDAAVRSVPQVGLPEIEARTGKVSPDWENRREQMVRETEERERERR